MKFTAAVIAAFAAFACVAAVQDLTDDDFDSYVSNAPYYFVKFYAPWCGHCKRLAPTWSKLADAWESNENVKVAKVDCTQNKGICSKQGVRGYPTLKLFKGDSKDGVRYSGGRSFEDLNSYIETHTGETMPESDNM